MNVRLRNCLRYAAALHRDFHHASVSMTKKTKAAQKHTNDDDDVDDEREERRE